MIYSLFLWRNGFRRDNHVNYLLLLFGFGLHSGAMLLRGFRLNHCPVSNLYEATIFAMWTIGPPHWGQVQSGRGEGAAFSSDPVLAGARPDSASSCKQSGSDAPRRR